MIPSAYIGVRAGEDEENPATTIFMIQSSVASMRRNCGLDYDSALAPLESPPPKGQGLEQGHPL